MATASHDMRAGYCSCAETLAATKVLNSMACMHEGHVGCGMPAAGGTGKAGFVPASTKGDHCRGIFCLTCLVLFEHALLLRLPAGK